MGLLDDAIREHLDLKRRHGAAADEVERLEKEALGSPLREAEPLDPPDAAEAPDATVPPPVPAAALEEEREPELPEPDEPDEPEPPVHQPTVEYSVQEELLEEAEPEEELPAPDEGLEGEDVLEETPEFLSETPEHDRLWFEQKPPRDFDFDH